MICFSTPDICPVLSLVPVCHLSRSSLGTMRWYGWLIKNVVKSVKYSWIAENIIVVTSPPNSQQFRHSPVRTILRITYVSFGLFIRKSFFFCLLLDTSFVYSSCILTFPETVYSCSLSLGKFVFSFSWILVSNYFHKLWDNCSHPSLPNVNFALSLIFGTLKVAICF